jgi:hypothetical protein
MELLTLRVARPNKMQLEVRGLFPSFVAEALLDAVQVQGILYGLWEGEDGTAMRALPLVTLRILFSKFAFAAL